MAEDGGLHRFDMGYRQRYALLCGVDEAGRGPLCGPVSIGAVILDPQNPVAGVNDSKKLSEKKREALYEEITAKAVAWQVVFVQPEEIDTLNIHHATLEGMRRVVALLSVVPDFVLIDGAFTPVLPMDCECVKKGDATSACIAAASILAKVTRDRYMCELDKHYPQYGYAQHKGYPTKLHYEMLEKHGIQSFYRKTFLKGWAF